MTDRERIRILRAALEQIAGEGTFRYTRFAGYVRKLATKALKRTEDKS